MLEIIGKDIKINRGDEVDLFFSFEKDPPEDGTAIRFAVKATHSNTVIKKETVYENKQIHVHLSSNETDLNVQDYSYGLYIQYGDGNGYSPLAESKFTVRPSEAYPGKVIM